MQGLLLINGALKSGHPSTKEIAPINKIRCPVAWDIKMIFIFMERGTGQYTSKKEDTKIIPKDSQEWNVTNVI